MGAPLRVNADITLFIKYIENGDEKYWSKQIRGVAWENRKGANVIATGGNINADQAAIFVPMAPNVVDYVDTVEWASMTDHAEYFTLKQDDIIVRGLVDDEIGATFTISDLKRKYPTVMAITSIDQFDNGSMSLWHWKIGAK